jgi:CelD/BcsL family acetyltransferase involved in cellulose biosynthesis
MLRDQWEELLLRVPRATAFQSPDWLGTWWRVIGSARRGSEPWVLLVRDAAGTLVGLVPLHLRRYSVGPARLRVLYWLGYRPGRGVSWLTDTLGPLVAAGYETAAAEATLRYLWSQARGWDLLVLIRTPDPFVERILARAETSGYHAACYQPLEWLRNRLSDDWSVLRRTLRKSLRGDLALYRNRLQREGRHESFAVLTAPEEVLAALPHFFALHRLRARAADMRRHSDYYAQDLSKVFTVEIARTLSAQGRLALAQLSVDGAVVAAQLLLLCGQTMTANYASGFDPEWRRHGVMTLLMEHCVEYGIGRGMRWLDLSSGASQAKQRWATETPLWSRTVQVARPSPLPLCAAWAIRHLYTLRSRG